MESRTVDVGGVRVRWEEQGQGHPVVLVHGIPTSPDLWRHVIPRVRGARCLALEMPGYGRSMDAGREHPISVERQAAYLLGWLDALKIDRALLVGHDLGGGVAQIAATRRRELVAGLLLTNSIGYDSWPIPSVRILRASRGVVRHLPSSATKMIIGSLMMRGHDDTSMAKESLEIHWQKYAAVDSSAALIRQIQALDVRDTLAVAEQIPQLSGIPARVIWGAADQFQKVKYGERFAQDLGVRLQRIEGGRHFTPEDHPGVLAQGINTLIEEAF